MWAAVRSNRRKPIHLSAPQFILVTGSGSAMVPLRSFADQHAGTRRRWRCGAEIPFSRLPRRFRMGDRHDDEVVAMF